MTYITWLVPIEIEYLVHKRREYRSIWADDTVHDVIIHFADLDDVSTISCRYLCFSDFVRNEISIL